MELFGNRWAHLCPFFSQSPLQQPRDVYRSLVSLFIAVILGSVSGSWWAKVLDFMAVSQTLRELQHRKGK